jgi:hypothetical protein
VRDGLWSSGSCEMDIKLRWKIIPDYTMIHRSYLCLRELNVNGKSWVF